MPTPGVAHAHLAFAFIRAALGGDFGAGRAFPYPFMDVGVHGVGGVALWILGLTVTLVLVGYVYVAVDALLARMAGSVPPAGVEPALGRV